MISSLALIAATVEGAEAHGGPIAEIAHQFGVNWPMLISQIVCFAIVAAVLHKFAYKPILAVLEERRKTIKESLENAEKIKKELADAQKTASDILAQANVQAQKFLEEAREAAAKVQSQKSQEAVAQAESIIKQAREASTQDYEKMKAELRREIGRLVVDTTAKVVGKVITAEDQKRLSEAAAKELAA